jgi:hypothetical protein
MSQAHYTYMITLKAPTDSRKFYIGVRSCKCAPNHDNYFGSSRPLNKWLKQNGKVNVEKQVLAIWKSRVDAVNHEMLLQDCFDVVKNPEFWNRAKQTSTGFDTTGLSSAPWNKGYPSKYKGVKRPEMSERLKGEKNHWFGKPSPMRGRKNIGASIALKGRKRPEGGGKPSKKVIRGDGVVFDSIASAASDLGKSRRGITMCCMGNAKTAHGFTWKYLEQ